MRIFANKSETCILLGASVDEEMYTCTCKLLILFPEAPFPCALWEIFSNGESDKFLGLYQIKGNANTGEYRMFRNVTFEIAKVD